MSDFQVFTKKDGFQPLGWTYESLFGDETDVLKAYAACGLGGDYGRIDAVDDGLAGVCVYLARGETKLPQPMFALVDVWESSSCFLSVFAPTGADYFALLNELRGHVALALLQGGIEDRKQRILDELRN